MSDAPTLSDKYQAAVDLMNATGESVWLINGAYLLAETGLIGFLANSLLDRSDGGFLVVIGALLGMIVLILWWASFERSYGFYNFRIHYVRSLESTGGFNALTEGEKLAKGDEVKVINEKPFGTSLRIRLPGRFRNWGIETWTRYLILLFGLVFVGLLAAGAFRMGTHRAPPPAIYSVLPGQGGGLLNITVDNGDVYRVQMVGKNTGVTFVGNIFAAKPK
jgi:hypothetical protein